MASLTLSASFLGGAVISDKPSAGNRRRVFVVNAAKDEVKEEAARGRRAAVLAVAAAAFSTVVAVQKGAMASDEPKKGSPEAKKKYAPVCITMPTASICRK